ncbi:MAG: hypothetical protein H7235_06570 [Bdellovibrionaceae bacterium]|nr:hypothetical protein [Pseudobdellovibrionaceae bacterium]
MLSMRLNKTILSVISITSLVSSLAMAQLTPGPSHGGGGSKPPSYDPCSVPTDPNCGGSGGGGIKPGPSYPSNPSYPSYPSYPSEPSYPNHPSYPYNPSTNFGSLTRDAIDGNLGRCVVRTHVSGWANQLYINGTFSGNYEDGSKGYNDNSNLENDLRNYVNNGRCGYVGGYNPSPNYPTDPYPNNNHTVLRAQIQRSVYNQSVDLRALFNLRQNYVGYRIVSVSATTTPNSPAVTIANLVINGLVVASERNPGYDIYLDPEELVRMYSATTSVNLAIQGSTYIQEIQIELSRN